MHAHWRVSILIAILSAAGLTNMVCRGQATTGLPHGAKAVWDLNKAHRKATPTRERICINGLWQWQSADPKSDAVPADDWGYFKVPGCWPGITDYMQKDFQTVHAHPSWKDVTLAGVTAAWYQREITIPDAWAGRRIAVCAEYLNSFAAVCVDGKRVGEIRFPAGEVDLTMVCRPGVRHVLSMLVVAMPLEGVMLSYNDSNSAREVKGSVARRGLCGDVYLVATPAGPRLGDVKVDTSVRDWEVTFEAAVLDPASDGTYRVRAQIGKSGEIVREFTGKPFRAGDLDNGRMALTQRWRPDKLWDVHTPDNQYEVTVSLLDAAGNVLDTSLPMRFGFREFRIDGRDFYLNDTRIFLCAVPLDNAQVGAALATYEGARESLTRLQSFGINAVYTHNYGCQPGSHLSFAEILRAADDVGMLVCLSQPHFAHYDWQASDADQSNGYARHAAFYVRVAQNHPSVVMYSMSHNATGYSEDMNPDLIDGVHDARTEWSRNNVRRAVRAEAIVRQLDPSRIVYHHSSGNLGSMHTSNFYPNWVPIQEMSDWFEHWATEGVKPFFTCEYGAPFTWDWSMYRGWYQGSRNFGSAVVPWDFCLAEWNAQFLGDVAYLISEEEKTNLRWEAEQFRAGRLWHRWDYPHQLGSRDFKQRYPVLARYLTDNWRAFRTWGVSAISPWEHGVFWKLRPDMDRNRRVELRTDWEKIQRPGFSPDYIEDRYERMDLAYERTDWVATLAAKSMYRNNGPLLAYLAGKSSRFTSKDHNFLPGETVEKQIIVINNSRSTVTCDGTWSLKAMDDRGVFSLGRDIAEVVVPTGQQERIPVRAELPGDLKPGTYRFRVTVKFSTGETQEDRFDIHVLPLPSPDPPMLDQIMATPGLRVALLDPQGETRDLLESIGVRFRNVDAMNDVSDRDLLIVGKGALTTNGRAPNIWGFRDGLKVLIFEQTSKALQKRLGFRVQEYGLRNVFKRVPDHPVLAGLDEEHLRDWRGEATILPPRLAYEPSDTFNGAPVVRWCGFEVPRLWRCGNRGNVASVLIEKPSRGDFLPIVDGGFGLQYSPLMEYRYGRGLILLCQMDVTGRTEEDPVARRLVSNMLSYLASPASSRCAPSRKAIRVGNRFASRYFRNAGISFESYKGGQPLPDQVLVVDRGAGQALAKHAPAIARWLKAGGHMLVLDVDADEANTFLPSPITTTRKEHIATYIERSKVGSLFAGIGPADLHNRDPRELPLVTGGAKALGNGVLARADGMNVVFCQLSPDAVDASCGDPPGISLHPFGGGVDGKQSVILTMGTVPWGQFGQKVEAGQISKTYTFSAFVKPIESPITARLEVERAGRPWDRVVRGEDVQLPTGKWTELHVTFTVDKPYPDGWSAYLHCGKPATRINVDLFQLYEGDYLPTGDNSPAKPIPGEKNLFENPSFEKGTESWFFTWKTEQQNVRKTYRRSSFLVTRLLANMGVRSHTPLIHDFSDPVSFSHPFSGGTRKSVVKNGHFRLAAADHPMPADWQFTTNVKQATCVLAESDEIAPHVARRCLRISCPELDATKPASLMLAQHDVPVQKGQWYRISLRAKSKGLSGARVALALQNTATWRSLFEYQRFTPGDTWKEFTFLVQANATATTKTRFQVWHGNAGTLWLSGIRMMPCSPPSEGRWTTGLYVDRPQPWDDPYRFFRW